MIARLLAGSATAKYRYLCSVLSSRNLQVSVHHVELGSTRAVSPINARRHPGGRTLRPHSRLVTGDGLWRFGSVLYWSSSCPSLTLPIPRPPALAAPRLKPYEIVRVYYVIFSAGHNVFNEISSPRAIAFWTGNGPELFRSR